MLNIENNNFITGLFTYNFIYLLDKFRISNICNFKNVITNNCDIWSQIKMVANQTASIF